MSKHSIHRPRFLLLHDAALSNPGADNGRLTRCVCAERKACPVRREQRAAMTVGSPVIGPAQGPERGRRLGLGLGQGIESLAAQMARNSVPVHVCTHGLRKTSARATSNRLEQMRSEMNRPQQQVVAQCDEPLQRRDQDEGAAARLLAAAWICAASALKN